MAENKENLESKIIENGIEAPAVGGVEFKREVEAHELGETNLHEGATELKNVDVIESEPENLELSEHEISIVDNEAKKKNLNELLQTVEETTAELTGDHPGEEFMRNAAAIQDGALDLAKNSDNVIGV